MLPSDINLEQEVTWKSWGKVSHVNNKTGCESKGVGFIITTGTLGQCLEQFINTDVLKPGERSSSFVRHCFTASFQFKAYLSCIEFLTFGQLVIVQDFGQNRNLPPQDEVKGNYWGGRKQITLHPSVATYLDENGKCKNLTITHLSDITSHSAAMVHHITKDCIDILIKKHPTIEWKKVILWSDGCAAQYKGKHSFFFLDKLPIPAERNFFGSEHGKSKSDAETGVISTQLTNAVKSRTVIFDNASEMC